MKYSINLRYFICCLPVPVFILIAIHHFYLVHNHHLSPWLGGGYGMFSTTDYGPSRFIKVFAIQDDIIQEQIEIPEHLAMLAKKARSLPDEKNIRKLSAELERYLAFNQHLFPVIRIEIWGTRYEPETLQPAYHKLISIEYQTDQ